MQWLSDLCVILDGEQLLNASYHSYTAAPGQFSLDKPYQAKQQNSTATTSSDTRTVPPEFFPERALGLTSDTVPLVEPNHVVAWQNTARKRKRKPRLVDAQRIHRQQESDERHDSRQPILLAALKLLQQQTAQVHSHLLCNRPASEATPRQRDAEEGEADQHSSTETLDLCALHALKYTLHPKFHFADSTDPDPHEEPTVNLFDTLISNSHHQERSAAAYDAQVLIPAHATFLMSDVKRLQPLLSGLGYHCIILDPPWENKSAKRGSKYPTLPSRNLMGIPLQKLMHQDGCLVGLWVTNRERHLRFIHDELLPHWGLSLHATWYWLKVTGQGELVSPLDVDHRRPYEVLMLLCPSNSDLTLSDFEVQLNTQPEAHVTARIEQQHDFSPSEDPSAKQGAQLSVAVPDGLVMVSVPGEHSRKPKLAQLLQRYLPGRANCLEMFARELTAGWTSWGNEALHFQQIKYFAHS